MTRRRVVPAACSSSFPRSGGEYVHRSGVLHGILVKLSRRRGVVDYAFTTG
jgi:hypothetical protein